MNVIPEPRRIDFRQGNFILKDTLCIRFQNDRKKQCAGVIEVVEKDFAKLKIQIRKNPFEPGGNTTVAWLTNASYRKAPLHKINALRKKRIASSEGYILDVSETDIVIVAKDGAGLFYGFQTLLQLVQKQGRQWSIPAVYVEDWPEMKMRGIHIDVHNITPTVSAIIKRLQMLARHKVNTVIIPYTDKFKFERHPKISDKQAFTKDEVRKIVATARSLFIDVIPVIQSFGHSANVLVHEEYAHLREGYNNITQFCPLHPGTLEMFKEMAEEVMEVHDSKYFHIGADETYFLGACEKCRKVVAKKGKIGLYVDYVSKVCDYLVSRGKIPMVWDDMMCNSPGKIKQLHPAAVICYWDYMPVEPKMPYVFFRNDGWYCDRKYWRDRKWWIVDFINSGRCRDIYKLADEKMKYYKPYLFDDNDNYHYINAYPFYGYFKDSDNDVIACPAAIGGEYGYIAPNYHRRINNMKPMIDLVAQSSGTGVITTAWTEMLVAEELIFYLLVYSAEYCWSPNAITLDKYNAKFVQQFFGCDDRDIIIAMNLIGNNNPPLCYTSEDHSDIKERGGHYAESETHKIMLENRIKTLFAKTNIVEAIEKLKRAKRDIRSAKEILQKCAPKIKKNRLIFAHLNLAAEMVDHKTDQALLFIAAEQLLTRRQKPAAARAALKRKLSALKKQLVALRSENRRLFSRSYKKPGVEKRLDTVFKGEAQKIDEYIERLGSPRKTKLIK